MRSLRGARPLGFTTALLAALLLAGCAGLGGDRRPPEEQVRERARAWLDAVLAKDLETAYTFTSPNYRQLATPGRYHARIQGAATWQSGEIDQVTCAENTCDVRFIVEYRIPRLKVSNRRPLEYRWVRIDGRWWLHVPG